MPGGLLVHARAETALDALCDAALWGRPKGGIGLVYLDPPFRPSDAFPRKTPHQARHAWTEMVDRCAAAAAELVRGEGSVCLHIDESSAALCRRLLRKSFGRTPSKVLWEREPGARDLLLFSGVAAERLGPQAVWTAHRSGSRAEAQRESALLFPGAPPFPHPKPERLLRRVIALATSPGDVVIDAFLGSATGAAVAHKMRRSWIGIEHDAGTIETYSEPRLRAVVAGGDRGGVAPVEEWRSGGSFGRTAITAQGCNSSP